MDYTDLVTCEEADAVVCLARLVAGSSTSTSSSGKDLQKEACWTLSNIAAGKRERRTGGGLLCAVLSVLPPLLLSSL